MSVKRSQLAKLTRPRLHKAVARERLFALLDEASQHKSAICVTGPPGAGKTTLVASWLDARGIKGIWYQVDPGDADLATFFYYLGEAAKPFTRKGQRPLPLLTPEYLQDIDGFSRRFFRELFSRLPEGSGLVLDNYQEVPPGQEFHQVVAQAVDESPEATTLVAISRRGPPDCYARLIANSNIELVDWAALQFTFEEAAALASIQSCVQGDLLRQIHDLSDGWAAGLTLLLGDSASIPRTLGQRPHGREALFAYFAEEIFGQVSHSTRTFLVTTALLSQVPVSLASKISGNPGAANILEDLYRRHLFTHRRFAREPVYWYHALFRDFLLSRISYVLGADVERSTRLRVAQMVRDRGEIEEAVRLFLEAGHWNAAADQIEAGAEFLLSGGRNQTLRDWISSLPDSLLCERPRLHYWLGASLLQTHPPGARKHLEFAVAQSSQDHELDHHALTAAAMIDSYFYEWSDFRPVTQWVEVLESLIDQVRLDDRPDLARRLHTSLLTGMLYVDPGNRMLPRIVQRVSDFIDTDIEPNSKISTAIILLSYCNIASDMNLGRSVVTRCAALAALPELTPINQLWWQLRLGYYHELFGDYSSSRRSLDSAVDLWQSHGFRQLTGTFLLIASYQVSSAASEGDLSRTSIWYERIVAAADTRRPMDAWHVDEAKVQLEALRGNYRTVAEIAEDTVARTAATEVTYIQILAVVNLAIGRAALGDDASARDALARLRSLISGTCFSYFECVEKFLEAYFSLKHGNRTEALALLCDALEFAREQSFSYPQTVRFSSIVGELFATALRAGIKFDYVEETIRRLGIRAPADAPASWPWPVKVRTLGSFEIVCDGKQLDFGRKAPKKPLALLKCLIAFGGRNVPEYRIADALWPGEDADLAVKALDVTLVRLRELLGQAHAVITSDGVLSLNANLFWTDVWAFEAAAQGAAQCENENNGRLGEAMALYAGEFLPADTAPAWSLKLRERLRGTFLRLVENSAKRLENRAHWEAAIDCYERGLTADDLAEPFYQGLMRCYSALGRHTEAMSVYRKLRQILSVVLGMAPSESTQALARKLQAENPAQPGD